MIRKLYLCLVLAVLTLVTAAPASASTAPGVENRTGVFDLVGGLCVGLQAPGGGDFVGGNGAWGYDLASRSTLAARGGTRAAEEMITLHHGSVSDYTEILTSGLKASRAPTWVTTEMTAARNAIGPGRVMSPGQGLNKGVITSTVPRAQFEALQEAGAISNLRTWPGFGGGQTFTEFVLRKPAAFDLFNAGIVR